MVLEEEIYPDRLIDSVRLMKAKIMMLINAFLGLFYVASSFNLWGIVDQWNSANVSASWSPTIAKPIFFHVYVVSAVYNSQFNFPFVLFLIFLGVNLIFIYDLQKGKETKPTMPGNN